MGISAGHSSEGNDQHVINDGQLQVHPSSPLAIRVVHVLPNRVIGMGGHALVEVG